MRIAHFSDLHMSSLEGVSLTSMLNKRATGYANWRLRRGAMHRPEYVHAIAKEVTRQAVDHVVVTGDLTNLALEPEFQLALAVLRDDLGVDMSRISVVPGNHDVYTAGAERDQRFATCFSDYIGTDLPLLRVSVPAGRFPFVKLRGPVAIIGLSSAVARAPLVAAGRIGPSQRNALARILEDKEVRARTPIILLHHPVHNAASCIKSAFDGLADAKELRGVLHGLTRGIVLHGHLHRRVRHGLRTIAGSVPVVGATSASLHHADRDRAAGFNVYEIDDAGSVTHVDAHVFEPEHGTFVTRPIVSNSEYPPPSSRV